MDLTKYDPSSRCAEARPPKGEYRLKQKADKRKLKAEEDAVMAEAVKRDHGKCRWPRCRFKVLKVSAAHLEHRGMGGNPSLDRTERHKLIAMCVRHHDQFDGRTLPFIDVQPTTDQGTDGLCAFYVQLASGEWQHVATEKAIGISETRGA